MFLHVWWALFVETRFVELKVFLKTKDISKEIIKAQEKGTCTSLRHVSRNLLMGALAMLVSKLVTSRQAVSRHMMFLRLISF